MLQRSVLEALADFYCPQPTHVTTDDFCSVHRHPSGGRSLSLGTGGLCYSGLQRWVGRLARTHTPSTDSARPVSGSNRRQAFAEHDVSYSLNTAQDPVEVYGARVH